ncbi:MAG: glycosyltransferase family 4 protein [Coriobacteriia bacterium]|nr:glycosyltransferase family 4 protein [Coriobacteriia bacterium]
MTATTSMKIAVVGIDPQNVHFTVYVRHLVRQGHDVTVITNRASVDAPVKVCDFTADPRVARFLPRGLRLIPRLWRLRRCLSAGFDVVDIQQVTPDGVYAALLCQDPFVLDFWGSDIHRLDQRPWIIRWLMPKAIQRASAIHSVSQEMTAALAAAGASPERIETFQYGIALDVFAPGPEARPCPLVAWSRGLRPFYRLESLIRAMPLILSQEPDARVVVAGAGESEPLRAIASELGVDHAVDFVGVVSPSVLAGYLQSARVWVSLPPTDGAPLSLLEAMACGAVPVVLDIPAVREWIDTSSAVFVEDVCAEAVARGVLEGFARYAEGGHRALNLKMVKERGDQAENLPRWERLLVRVSRGLAEGQVG